MKIKGFVYGNDGTETIGYHFWCPGCDSVHGVRVRRHPTDHPQSPVWGFNGNEQSPTFTPSILVHRHVVPETGQLLHPQCHSFVRDGQIQFLGDCDHALAGKTAPIPDWPWR